MTPWYAALSDKQRASIPYETLDLDTQETLGLYTPYQVTWASAAEGMRVKIVREVESCFGLWTNSWTRYMSHIVGDGRVFKVRRVDYYSGIYLMGADYGWPPEALEQVIE